MIKKQDGLIEDFRALKGEMYSIFNTRLWGTVTYVIFAGGIGAVQLEKCVAVKYIFIIFGALPLLIHTIHRERSRIRIADYIRNEIEPNVPGLNWENYLFKWRNSGSLGKKWKRTFDCLLHIFSLTGIYSFIVLFAMFLLCIEAENVYNVILGGIGVVLCVCAHVYFYSILRLTKVIIEKKI